MVNGRKHTPEDEIWSAKHTSSGTPIGPDMAQVNQIWLGSTKWVSSGIGPKRNCSKMVRKSFNWGLGNGAGGFCSTHQGLAAHHRTTAGNRCHRVIANATPDDCGRGAQGVATLDTTGAARVVPEHSKK